MYSPDQTTQLLDSISQGIMASPNLKLEIFYIKQKY